MADTVAGGRKKKFKIGSASKLASRLVSSKNGLYAVTLAVSIEHYKLLAYLAQQNQMSASQIVRDILDKVFSEDLKELEIIEQRLRAKGQSDAEILLAIRDGFSVSQAKSRAPRRKRNNDQTEQESSTQQTTELRTEKDGGNQSE